MKNTTSWSVLISKEMRKHKDGWKNVIDSTLTDDELHQRFNNDYGIEEGKPFLVWSSDWVYFPVLHDGKQWVGSVPRNPTNNKRAIKHFGE